MRTLIWSNAFTKSFKRWMRKRPDLANDIAEALTEKRIMCPDKVEVI